MNVADLISKLGEMPSSKVVKIEGCCGSCVNDIVTIANQGLYVEIIQRDTENGS